jgi:hypothetical protein
MSIPTTDPTRATLPDLERHLLHAAHRRAGRGARLRRPGTLAALVAAVAVTGGAVATATGVFTTVDRGTNARGEPYAIERTPVQQPLDAEGTVRGGTVCLQLRPRAHAPAYGCGPAPTAAEPFGLVVADSSDAATDRIVYGLVGDGVARVSVLGQGTAHTDGATVPKPGLPGRFFSVTVPNRGRIELVGYAASGREVARIGSRATPAHPPRSQDEARAQGDPAGFAPAIAAPQTYTYEGHQITDAQLRALKGVSCVQRRDGIVCHDGPPRP